MNCSTCGLPLAEGIHICPRCGTPTINYPGNARANDPTIAASYVRQQTPPTHYGPEQQYAPPPPQYNNYVTPPQISPGQPPSQKSKAGIAMIAGLVILLIVLIGGSLIVLHKQGSPTTSKGSPNATQMPTPTPNILKNPYPPGTGTLFINDPLQDNSKGYNWVESTTPITGGVEVCSFKNGAYHISRTVRGSLVCPADAPDLTFANIVCEAKLTVTHGDYSGIAFRINRAQATGYVFAVGVASDYVIDTFDFKAPTDREFTILRKGSNTAIKRGWNQTNVVAIVANGPVISVYINNQFIDRVQDSTYTQGEIGLYGYGQTTSDIMANDIKVWRL